MAFLDDVKETLLQDDSNKTLSENGAVMYISSGSSLVDFNFSLNSFRNKSADEIQSLLAKCYAEDPETTTALIFKIGDVRNGDGERRTFDICMDWLINNHLQVSKQLLPLVSEYTRWDHVSDLIIHENKAIAKLAKNIVVNQLLSDTKSLLKSYNENNPEKGMNINSLNTNNEIINAFIRVYKEDKDGLYAINANNKNKESISLCAKWIPSVQSKKAEDRIICTKIRKELGLNESDFRKLLSGIRGNLNILEKYKSENRMDEINYENLSAKAIVKNQASLSKDESWQEHIEKVNKGEAKMNMSVATPFDVLCKYKNEEGWRRTKFYDESIETMWKQLPDKTGGNSNTLVIRDGSGSMDQAVSKDNKNTILDLATALSIYYAEKQKGEFHDKFITFSSRPEIVDMSNLDNLHDKIELCYDYNDCSNTNLEKTFDLLLNAAINKNLSQEELPSNLLIISDMEFDASRQNKIYCGYLFSSQEQAASLMDGIREKWDKAGYKMPQLIFWNVNAERAVIPEINRAGVVLMSGFSTNNLEFLLEGNIKDFTPEKYLSEQLSNPIYNPVREAYKKGHELELNKNRRNNQKDIETIEYR